MKITIIISSIVLIFCIIDIFYKKHKRKRLKELTKPKELSATIIYPPPQELFHQGKDNYATGTNAHVEGYNKDDFAIGIDAHTESSPIKVITYADKLKDDKWQQKRLEIINRDHYCRFCGSSYNLQVHHKYYSKYPNGTKVEPWNYPNTALIVLCANCHKKWHDKHKCKIYYRKYGQ